MSQCDESSPVTWLPSVQPMPLKIPVTASFPPSISRGGAVCSGPDIEGMGRGCGSGGFVSAAGVLAGVEAGVLCGSEEVVCPNDGNAARARTSTARKQINRVRKVDLLNFDVLVQRLYSQRGSYW